MTNNIQTTVKEIIPGVLITNMKCHEMSIWNIGVVSRNANDAQLKAVYPKTCVKLVLKYHQKW